MCDTEPPKAYEMFTGRELPVRLQSLKIAELKINQRIIVDGSATLNDLYDLLECDLSEVGEQLEWTSPVRFIYDAVLDRAERPQLRFRYAPPPVHESLVNR